MFVAGLQVMELCRGSNLNGITRSMRSAPVAEG